MGRCCVDLGFSAGGWRFRLGRWEGSREVVGGGIGRYVCTRSLIIFPSAYTGGSCSYMSGILLLPALLLLG